MLNIITSKIKSQTIEAWSEFKNDYNNLSEEDKMKANACTLPMSAGIWLICWKLDPWITAVALGYTWYKAYKLAKEEITKEKSQEAFQNYKSYMEGKA